MASKPTPRPATNSPGAWRADRQVVADLPGGGEGRARGAGQPRVLVEAELLGRLDEFLRAELRAQRGEDAVAGVREGDPQGAAAGLAVGVLDLDALDRRTRR